MYLFEDFSKRIAKSAVDYKYLQLIADFQKGGLNVKMACHTSNKYILHISSVIISFIHSIYIGPLASTHKDLYRWLVINSR